MTDHWQKFSFAPDVVVQVINGEALILKLQAEEVFSLNDTGARVAQLIDDGCAVDAMVDTLAREYAIERGEIEREVNGLLQVLLSKGLVVRRGSQGAE
jgi:hypothetical protein